MRAQHVTDTGAQSAWQEVPQPTRQYSTTMDNAVFAAIAMALHDDQGYNMHDIESGNITISVRPSDWTSKLAKMTPSPRQ